MGTRIQWTEIQTNDRSVEELLVEQLPRLSRVAIRLTGSATDAADLVQETCCRVIAKARYFRERSNAFGWFSRILQNIYYDRQRRRRPEVPLGEHDIAGSESQSIPSWRWVSDDEYAEALSLLPTVYRITYHRYAIDGHSYEAIARDLGISRVTVGVRLMRARTKIRFLLTGC